MLMKHVLVSNGPQLLFSVPYFQYNGLFAGMLAAEEWSNFDHKRKPLQVSPTLPGDSALTNSCISHIDIASLSSFFQSHYTGSYHKAFLSSLLNFVVPIQS